MVSDGWRRGGIRVAVWDTGDTTGSRGLATRLGLRFIDTPTDRSYEIEVGRLPNVGVLSTVDADAVTKLMYGRYRDCNLQVFDIDLATYHDDPASPRRSCAVVSFAANFPPLSITPHTPMSRMRATSRRGWLDFAPSEFRERFEVKTDDNDTARALLSDQALETLAAERVDVMLDLADGYLIGHLPQIDEDDQDAWTALVDYTIDFHALIPERAWVDFGTFGLS